MASRPASPDEVPRAEARATGAGTAGLALGSIGVVFGDIGTSPIYTIRESLSGAAGVPASPANVLGVLSVIFWSLLVIVTFKYVIVLLRADNRGEGGILAISALASRVAASRRQSAAVMGLAILGLGLFYGDGLLTPAISVLSAIEGLETMEPSLAPLVLPLTLAVLLGLFALQRQGTARIGRLYGPVMVSWFLTLAALGSAQLWLEPRVLQALDPRWAILLFAEQGATAFVALGAMVLAITGAEAVYADMGHFGRRPIRIAWLGLVLPALLLNYFGQGALVLRDAGALSQPFYHLAPTALLLPLVGLTTVSTVIASQAAISGVFSLTHQAIQLGLLPRMTVRHTSATEIGQIYVPRVNWLLAVGVIALVLGFGSSGGLAGAYGMSVTGTMGTTTLLAAFVAFRLWGWPLWLVSLVFLPPFLFECGYIAANSFKIDDGGWFPLLVALALALLVRVWRRGRAVLAEKVYGHGLALSGFIRRQGTRVPRVAGTAVFLTGNPHLVPNALLHNLKHNKVLHETVVVLSVAVTDASYVAPADRVQCEPLGAGFHRVTVRYGFMERPDVPQALALCRPMGVPYDPMTTSFFLARETLIAKQRPGLGRLGDRMFMALATTALSAAAYFGLPANRVVELGTQVEI